ncbi:autotransporter outer membrane beta-barrel domain-containing protein [Bartonella sp. CB60]|uniref:autotransporter outer membrane beta-barrel domain-containing protein n=1 Tax=Bartonella sp. CB60 TaxID=3113619 RepID=UPI00300DC2D7
MYKKSFLLSTVAGILVFSHFSLAYANTPLVEHAQVNVNAKGETHQTLNNVSIRDGFFAVIVDGQQSVLTIEKGKVFSGFAAFSASNGALIDAKKMDITALQVGLQIGSSTINLEDSVVTVKGDHKGYGISLVKGTGDKKSEATLTNTKISIVDGIGILGEAAGGSVHLKNSEIDADMLLKNVSSSFLSIPSTLVLTADHSVLKGKAKTSSDKKTILTLNNDSHWFLKISEGEVDNDLNMFSYALRSIDERAHSNISVLNLNDSTIMFNEPTEGQYQTLYIGKQEQKADALILPALQILGLADEHQEPDTQNVYNATGNANVYFNLKWSDGAAKEEQKADRLLIHGNVSGNTTIHLKSFLNGEDKQAEGVIPVNTRGLSLIQVSGEANETSFKLVNGYATMKGSPYKYTLNAFGPTSSHGKADIEQSLLGEDEDFWDFRLQSVTLDPDAKIKAFVPQVASYLVMPNAIFSAGFTDVSNQNALLDDMQTTASEARDNKKRGVLFSSYGNKVTLSSNRTPLQYGYGADVCYAALQAGIVLAAMEGQNIFTNFGLLGTYSKLAFTPKDMEGSGKSTLDKWSLTAYSKIQYDNDVYINALLSYGTLQGNITTDLIGNTAKVENTKMFGASATIGKKLATGTEGLVFEPQAQLIYQRLMFNIIDDIDNFEVDMGTPHQWVVRFGGRLTQTMISDEKNRTVSFYGKLNVLKAFSDKNTIKVADTLRLDSMGSSIEGGLGIRAQFTHNIALHGDVSYRHKLQKAGASGINFSGRIRYRF